METPLHPSPKRITSSALGYAIAFLLLIALVCCGVLFVSSAHKRLEYHYTMQEHMVFDNLFTLQLGASMPVGFLKTMPHSAGDTSVIQVKNWGSYRTVSSHTFHRQRHVRKTALIGDELNEELPVLYIPENNQSLRLAGNTKIEGDVFVSERGIDRASLSRAFYTNEQLVYGKIKKSDRYLPPLLPEVSNLTFAKLTPNTQKIETLPADSVFSFDLPTSLFTTTSPLEITSHLSGNLIIHSFDKITIRAISSLNHIILIAPEVEIESGFKGNIQVIAEKNIHCSKQVSLLYPSTLVLNENYPAIDGPAHSIQIDEESRVLGGILMVSQQSDYRKPIQLYMATETVVAGLVYNQGVSEIRGSILGHLYTNSLQLHYGGGNNVNHLLDCTLSSKQLPKDFVLPHWIKSTSTKNTRIVTRF